MLDQRIADRAAEAMDAETLGKVYLDLRDLRDVDEAERWFQHSLSLRPDSDRFGRASSLSGLGKVALRRFDDAQAASAAESELLNHLNAALRSYQQAQELIPADDFEGHAGVENQLGVIYRRAGDISLALRHYQRSIQYEEARGNIYGAAQTRHNIALLLASDGRADDALHYAHAALDNFHQVGPGAASNAALAARLIAQLESRMRRPESQG